MKKREWEEMLKAENVNPRGPFVCPFYCFSYCCSDDEKTTHRFNDSQHAYSHFLRVKERKNGNLR